VSVRGPCGHSALSLPTHVGVLHINENGVRIMALGPSYSACFCTMQMRFVRIWTCAHQSIIHNIYRVLATAFSSHQNECNTS
jgi:hypothetical protein